MKKLFCLVWTVLWGSTFVLAGDIVLKSQSQSGNAKRAIKTIVNYDETAHENDLMPLYLCKNNIPGADSNLDFKINNDNTTCFKGWACLDGTSNNSETLKNWVSNGYTFTVPQGLPFGSGTSYATPAELANACFMPGTKTDGLHIMQDRINAGKITVLVPVISQTSAQIYAGLSAHPVHNVSVNIINFAVFELVSVHDTGSDKYVTAKFKHLASTDDLSHKRVDYRASVEVQPK